MNDLPDALVDALADRYRLERTLGEGGMATVYLAQDLRHNRRVAVKVMRPVVAEAMGADRFLKEIEVTAGLQHPNIVPLFDSGRVGDLLWFAMPYLEGESLRARIDRDGAMPVDEAGRILEQVADALAYAHERGVIHRDIKPDNVMLVGRHAIVADFGVARALSMVAGAAAQTTAGLAIGTPSYMAPEQVLASPDIDHRADLYSLGAMGYEMLSGSPPFAGGNVQQRMIAHIRVEPDPLAERREGLAPEIASLIDSCLRKAPADRPPSAATVAEVFRRHATGEREPLARRPRWSVRTLAIAAALIVAAVAGAFLLRPDRAPAGPAPAAAGSTLAIFPFTVRGSPEVQYLGEGMVNLLTTTLDGAGGMRALDPRALLGTVKRRGDLVLTPTAAAGLARELGAGRFILGDIVEAGGRMRIDATLYDAADGGSALGRGTADGAPGAALELVDSVATGLLATGVAMGRGPAPSLLEVTTASLPALRSYLEGEREFRAGRYRESAEAFQRATAADSAFALAWFRLSIAAEWALQPELTRAASREAVRHASRLSEHDRMVLEALLAFRNGEVARAEQMFDGVLAIWPQDVDAAVQLGEIRFHWGPLLGEGVQGSVPAFERLLALQPDDASALVHLTRAAAARGDTTAVQALVERFMGLNPDGERSLEMLGFAAAMSPDASAWPAHLARLRRASDLALPQAVVGVAIWSDELAQAEAMASEERRPDRASVVQALGAIHGAYLATTQGRWAEAQTLLAAAEPLDPALVLEYRGALSLFPFVPVEPDTLRALVRRLASIEARAESRMQFQSGYFDIHNGFRAIIYPYLRGRLLTRLGDLPAARREVGALRAGRIPVGREALREQLARGVEAGLDAAEGREPDIERLQPLSGIADYESAMFSPIFSLGLQRYERALLLEAAGRAEEALAIYASFERFSHFDAVLAAHANLRAANLLVFAGRRDEARERLQRVLRLYRDPDPALRETRREAEAALARLDAGG